MQKENERFSQNLAAWHFTPVSRSESCSAQCLRGLLDCYVRVLSLHCLSATRFSVSNALLLGQSLASVHRP